MSLTALLILDRARLRSEYAQLGRLAVALTGSGCRVRSMMPDPPFGDDHPGDRPIGLDEVIRYPDRIAPWLRKARLLQLKKSLEREPPDLLWVAGESAWQLGAGLSLALERPMIVHLDGYHEARRLRRLGRSAPLAGVIAPSQPLKNLVATERPTCAVQCVVPGIAIGDLDAALRTRNDDGPISIAILGNCDQPRSYRALFEGLVALRGTGNGFRCILELSKKADQRIWRQLRRLGLTELTTVIGDPARIPRLLAASDLLVRPAAENRVRPIVLEAMANGTPVVSVEEPWLDYLGPEQGTTIVENPTPDAWQQALEPLLLDEGERKRLGALARETVIKHHRSSDRAEEVKGLFERVVGVDPIPLAKAQ